MLQTKARERVADTLTNMRLLCCLSVKDLPSAFVFYQLASILRIERGFAAHQQKLTCVLEFVGTIVFMNFVVLFTYTCVCS